MSLESRLTDFSEKYSLDESAIAELLEIWNTTFVEIAHGLLKDSGGSKPTKSAKSAKTVSETKKWASKVAGEYAQQKGFTLDDFTQDKISKKDVDTLIKERDSGEPSASGEIKKTKITKDGKTVKCCGLTKKGDPCSRTATHTPDGAKKSYCFRHANDWQDFEVSSDSSDSELEEEAPIARKKQPFESPESDNSVDEGSGDN
jgi:hypothetical protein